MRNVYYTGVGSRNTPLYIMYMMSELAMVFEKKGYILRSGCATGADAAFEDLLEDPANTAEIYIPNKGFPFKMGGSYKNHYMIPSEMYGKSFDGLYLQATRMIHSQEIHKAWRRCQPHIMDLHNRNMFQVLGRDLKTKSKFVVCYTRGKELTYDDTNVKTGGTATAINAAYLNKVDIFNLSVDEHYLRLRKFIDENKHLVDYEKLNKSIPRTERYGQVNNRGKYTKSYNELMDSVISERQERDAIMASYTEKNTTIKNDEKKTIKNKP